jgi:hypothetical protein
MSRTKTIESNGFIFEIELTRGLQSSFCMSGVAKRAGKVISSDLITGERANKWFGLIVPFKDESIKLAEKTLIEKLSKQALLKLEFQSKPAMARLSFNAMSQH